jgi:hypothetical protein
MPTLPKFRSPALALTALSLALAVALGCQSSGGIGSSALANLSEEDQAKLASWNQERVTAIAVELAPAINDVSVSINTLRTGAMAGSGQANAFIRLKDRVRVARNESRHLATQLKNGKGRLETVHTYSRLMTTIRDAREEGRRMMIEEPTLDKVAVAADLVRRLSPYYDPKSNQE